MATIRKEITIAVPPAFAWDAVRDFGALHTRLVPGFVTDTRLDGDARIVTFGNGLVAREVLVTVDEATRRLVWTIVGGTFTHHNGAVQVLPDPAGCRVVWVSDLLPDSRAAGVDAMMSQAMPIMRATLEAAAA